MKTLKIFLLFLIPGLISCSPNSDTPQPKKVYKDNHIVDGIVTHAEIQDYEVIGWDTLFHRPKLKGFMKVILNQTDTMIMGNYKPEAYAIRKHSTTDPSRFVCDINFSSLKYNGQQNYINMSWEISTTTTPVIGTHSLGWNYQSGWSSSTYVNDMHITTYNNLDVKTYSACFGTNNSYTVSSPYFLTITEEFTEDGINFISGNFEAELCISNRQKASGYVHVKGDFENIPVFEE